MERLTKQKKLLTTEDIASMCSRLESIEDILGPTYDLSRLKKLVEADREGRCKIFPTREAAEKALIGIMDGNT